MSEQVFLSPVAADAASACGGQAIEINSFPKKHANSAQQGADENDAVARDHWARDVWAKDIWAKDIWVGRAHIYCESGVFYCHADSPAALTPAELTLLKVFYDRPGQILDRDQLSELSLGRKWDPWNRCVDNHVSHLRRKIGTDPMDPGLIRTIRGKGYVYMP